MDAMNKTIVLLLLGLVVCSLVSEQLVAGSKHRKSHSNKHKQEDDNDEKVEKQGHKRIINGKKANVGQFPFMAAIKGTNGKIVCGGTIISDRHILTAGHCINRRPISTIFVGHVDLRHKGDDVQEFLMGDVFVHPGFTYNSSKIIANDVAIVAIKGHFKFGPNVAKLDLPEKGKQYPDGLPGIHIGWGGLEPIKPPPAPKKDIYPYELYYCEEKTFNLEVCAQKFHEYFTENFIPKGYIRPKFDKNEQICTMGDKQSSYKGDSGGPYVMKKPDGEGYELVGIVSEGNIRDPVNNPSLDTKVSGYVDVIREHIGKKVTVEAEEDLE